MVEMKDIGENGFLRIIICKEYFSSISNYFLVLYQDPLQQWYYTYENDTIYEKSFLAL